MNAREILNKINSCKTVPELDNLRLEVTTEMTSNDGKNFKLIQNAFIKKLNKLKRIPLRDRNW